MNELTILYDANCEFCRRVAAWLGREPAYLRLRFVAQQSEQAERLFPGVLDPRAPVELVVVSDEGGVYRDTNAYLMCLYALRRYRSWSFRLASPALKPLARNAFEMLSRHRAGLAFLAPATWRDEDWVTQLTRHRPMRCVPAGSPEGDVPGPAVLG